MKKSTLFFVPALAIALLSATAVQAESPSVMLEQRLKASYNVMVQDVRNAESPTEKREIMDGFLLRLDRGLGFVEKMTPASNKSHTAATEMRLRIQADRNELNAMDMHGAAAAGNLNSFASYLQQDVEQADGVYLSVGAIIIILLILILVL